MIVVRGTDAGSFLCEVERSSEADRSSLEMAGVYSLVAKLTRHGRSYQEHDGRVEKSVFSGQLALYEGITTCDGPPTLKVDAGLRTCR